MEHSSVRSLLLYISSSVSPLFHSSFAPQYQQSQRNRASPTVSYVNEALASAKDQESLCIFYHRG